MPEHFRTKLIFGLVAGLILLPPLLLLLRRGKRGFLKSALKWFALFLLVVDVAAVIILLLIRYAGLEMEWRGGYVPMVTWQKTKPDFDALERSRAEQSKLAASATNTPVATISIPENEWPGFRGPRSDGYYTNRPIITNWPAAGLRLLWKQACGGGYSSFALSDGRAFTLEQRRETEVLVAYDVMTGRELWTNCWEAKFTEYHSDEGPRSTPACSDGKVYALGATGEFRCLNASNGSVVWATNIVTQTKASLPDYGLSASPFIVGDKVILQPDAFDGFAVVCYDKNDGKILWHNLDLRMGYATPMLFNPGNEDQVIVCSRPYIVGLRLSDGVERWRYNWHVNNNERPITQPLLVNSNTVFMTAAYMTGCAKFEVTPSTNTAATNAFEAREIWRNKNLKSKFSSPVLWQGYIYGLDEDILCCVDASTGERKWKDGRYGYGQVLLASGHLLVQCANGDLALIKAVPEQLTEVARFTALHGKSWNEPAIGGGKILLRNNAEMACYEISATK